MLPLFSAVKGTPGRFISLALLLTLVACTPIRYYEIQAASPALKNLNTYRWEAAALTAADGANAYEFDSKFRATVESGLKDKGYVAATSNADLIVDYRISVVTRPGIEEPAHGPHWSQDEAGNFYFTGWEEPQGTGNMLEHGVVTLSLRATKSNDLLWEGGVSKLLESGADQVDLTKGANAAAHTLLQKIPSHKKP